MHKFYLLFLTIITGLYSCNIINPKEPVPTYLQLNTFQFNNPDSNITGSSSHDIPAAYIYADDQIIGTFDLPCTVPIIMDKDKIISIVPAVTNQGLKSYVFQYPFYSGDSLRLAYKPGEVYSYTPSTGYRSNMKSADFRMKISFEDGLFFKGYSGDTSMVLEKSPDMVFEGSTVGAIYLRAPQTYSENITQNFFEVSNLSNDCYMEFNYKCSLPFQVGIEGESTSGSTYSEYLAGFYPKSSWGKIYLDLATFMRNNSGYRKYRLKLRTTLEDGKYSEGYVLIDNIKVISRL